MENSISANAAQIIGYASTLVNADSETLCMCANEHERIRLCECRAKSKSNTLTECYSNTQVK